MGKIKQPVNPVSSRERWYFPALTSYTFDRSGQSVDALFEAVGRQIANVRNLLVTDAVPTEGSNNLLRSGAVYSAFNNVLHLGDTLETL
jgi:hypothetical protein